MMNLDNYDNWEQRNLIHCMNTGCKGMLMEHDDTYFFKCSKCGDYFWKEVNWIKTDNTGKVIE